MAAKVLWEICDRPQQMCEKQVTLLLWYVNCWCVKGELAHAQYEPARSTEDKVK